MITWLLNWIGFGVTILVAYGGVVLAVLAWSARFHPAVKWPLTEAAILVFGAALAASAWSFSAMHHDRQGEIDRLTAVIVEQARQRELAEQIAARAQARAQQRAAEVADLQEMVDDYDHALAAGTVSACPDDPDYAGRMRRISIGGTETGSAATRNGSDPAVPRSRPDR